MKKNRLLLLIAAAIWLAVGIQVIMNRLTDREGDILEAFSLTNTDTMESSLIMLAEYPDGFADRNEREEALFTLAEGIGLNIDGPFYEEESDSRSEIGFEKSGRYAATKLSSVRLIGENKTRIMSCSGLRSMRIRTGFLSIRSWQRSCMSRTDMKRYRPE